MGTTYTGQSATITGLTPGTQYRFRVRARNAVGYGPFSDWSAAGSPTGTTPGPTPTSPPGETWTKISTQLAHFAGVTSTGTAGQERLWAWRYNPESYGDLAQWIPYSLVYSTDGVSWSDASTFTHPVDKPGQTRGGIATFVPDQVAYGNGTYVATNGFASSTAAGVTSTGAAWQKVTLPAAASGVSFVNGKFLTLRNSSPYWSTTGLSWGGLRNFNMQLTDDSLWPTLLAASSSQFLWKAASARMGYSSASPLSSTQVATSGENAGTMYQAIPAISSAPFSSALPFLQAPNGSVLVADKNGKMYSSSNGTSWTTRTLPLGLLFGDGIGADPVRCGAVTARPLASRDGTEILALVRTADKATRTIARSSDAGATWETRVTLPELIEWSQVVYFKGKYIAVGYGAPSNFAAYYTT